MKNLAIFALLLAMPSVGESAPPRRPWEYAKTLYPSHADCIIRRQEPKIKAWLSLLAGTKAERRAFSKLALDFPNCFGAQQEIGWNYIFEAASMREALVTQLLKLNWERVPSAPPERLQNSAWYSPDTMREPKAAEAAIAYIVGLCVVRSNWVSSRRLSESSPGSQDEKESMRMLVGLLGGCVPPKMTLRLDKPRLRAIVEETVYHASLETGDA